MIRKWSVEKGERMKEKKREYAYPCTTNACVAFGIQVVAQGNDHLNGSE